MQNEIIMKCLIKSSTESNNNFNSILINNQLNYNQNLKPLNNVYESLPILINTLDNFNNKLLNIDNGRRKRDIGVQTESSNVSLQSSLTSFLKHISRNN